MKASAKARLNFWKSTVARWRAKYPPPTTPYMPKKGQHNPAAVRVALVCAKCGTTKRVKRHHKGHEFIFAIHREEWYAARYIEFRPEDVVPLCDKHHKVIHRLYKKIITELYNFITGPPKNITFERLETFRLRLVAKCDKWLRRRAKRA